jgi:hypothetical protein
VVWLALWAIVANHRAASLTGSRRSHW